MPPDDVPTTRWERSASSDRYAGHFAELIDAGTDIDGEARLADVLAPRHGQILDAGSGMGRVAAALAARGHDVTAVEKDPALVAEHRRRYPGVPLVHKDLLALTPRLLAGEGRPTGYDVVVAVGNVMVYLAQGTEVRALRTLGALLAPTGRLLVGFHTETGPAGSRAYPAEEFLADVAAAGLTAQHRFGSYDLAPPEAGYVVAVLARP